MDPHSTLGTIYVDLSQKLNFLQKIKKLWKVSYLWTVGMLPKYPVGVRHSSCTQKCNEQILLPVLEPHDNQYN